MNEQNTSTEAALEFRLSQAGAARRDALLPGLQGLVVRRRRRRTAIRIAGAASVPLVAIATVMAIVGGDTAAPGPALVRDDGRSAAQVVLDDPPQASGAQDAAPMRVVVVRTDPASVTRLVARTEEAPAHVRRLSDNDLIGLLSSQGRSVGIIRTAGRAIVADNTESVGAAPLLNRGEGTEIPSDVAPPASLAGLLSAAWTMVSMR